MRQAQFRSQRRRPRLRGLGQSDAQPSMWDFLMNPVGAAILGGAAATNTIPGSNVNDVIYNMTTGNVSQNQRNAMVAQETQSLVQTGVDPNTAASQAAQVVDQSLASATLPGAFGITWQGAGPSAPSWIEAGIQQTAIPTASDASSWLAQNWPWLALGAIGVWWVSKQL